MLKQRLKNLVAKVNEYGDRLVRSVYSASVILIAFNLATISTIGILYFGLTTLMEPTFEDVQVVKEMVVPYTIPTEKVNAKKYYPLVRLYDLKGEFICSGSVISDDYVLTAAHCVDDNDYVMKTERFIIQSENQPAKEFSVGKAVAMAVNQDIALIKGDFKKYNKLYVDFTSRGIHAHAGPFMTCGFPNGAPSVCYPYAPLSPWIFKVKGNGVLYPGMSGGPVLDARTGEIVAVNSQMSGEYAVVAPMIGFFANVKVKIQFPKKADK